MANKIEIQVIDDRMLIDGIIEEKAASEAEIQRINGDYSLVDLSPNVESLSLSFKRIARIENLVGFDKLLKLCLDNNHIKEIQNLSHLVHLKWLDLSFNEIKKISGLEKLIHLEDLSLYKNQISVVEGLEKCTKLQCLSLGNNLLDGMDPLYKIRSLKGLKMLTLAGNPISKMGDYKLLVLAYIDDITYLDYALIDPADRALAKEQYHDDLLDMKEKESVLITKNERDLQHQQYMAQLEEAGISFAYTIFDDIFVDDPDMERLKHLPGVKDQMENFRNGFKGTFHFPFDFHRAVPLNESICLSFFLSHSHVGGVYQSISRKIH